MLLRIVPSGIVSRCDADTRTVCVTESSSGFLCTAGECSLLLTCLLICLFESPSDFLFGMCSRMVMRPHPPHSPLHLDYDNCEDDN